MKRKSLKPKPIVYDITITLAETSPKVWRKVLVHDFIELNELHILIQMAMGWKNYHLFSFEINGRTYSDAETALEMSYLDASEALLCDVIGTAKKFSYTYDFGDNWHHEIEVTNKLKHDPRFKYPACIGGENACPPEGCGGPHGFDKLKQTLLDKESEERDELLTWLGGFYDPRTFDPNFVNNHFFWDI